MPNWKKLIVSGSDAALNSLNVTSTFTASGLNYPTTNGDNGDFLTTDGIGNLSFGRPNVYANVKNVSGVQLLKGTPVHATGTAGNTSEVIAASASVASTMPATFVLNETLANDAEGLALVTGYINGIDTSAFEEGDVVYVGATGSYTNIKPQGSNNLIQNIGLVNKVDASNGSGYVYGSGRSNDVPNLPIGKIWVGSDTYTVTSSILTLDEDNSHAQITGSLSVSSVVNAGTDTDKFLVLDSLNNVDFRTGAEVRSDIGAGTGNGTVTGTGANNQVTTWNGTTSLDGSSNFTYDGTTLNLSYTGTGDLLRLTSTDAGAASAPDLTFCRNSASPADDDTLGTIQFYGEVSGTSVCKNYASIYGRIACATNGQTKGNLSFKAECNNVFIDTANFSPNGLYVMPPDDFAITSPGIGLTVTGGVSGSTTLQIGSGHTNTGTLSTIAGGTLNTASAACSFIGGGISNSISSNYSQNAKHVIVGGNNNSISGEYQSHTSVIVGGQDNTLSGAYNNFRFIGAGCNNTIENALNRGVIVGGVSNTIDGPYGGPGAFIGAGELNTVNSPGGIIVGGCCNSAPGGNGGIFIGGGLKNKASGEYSSIVGGTLNTASAACSFIGGGCNNSTGTESYTTIVGGQSNIAQADHTFIGGGRLNCIGDVATDSVIVGGSTNDIVGDTNGVFIGGGANNCICNEYIAYTFIGGGSNNYIDGDATNENDHSVIVGGCLNKTEGACSFIGAGKQNKTGNVFATVVGGTLNTGSGACSFIGGGASNTAAGTFSYAGGEGSCASGAQSFAHGYQAKASGAAAAAVGGALSNACGDNSFVAGGSGNDACSQYGFAGGAFNELTTSAKASSVLGESNCINAPWSFAVGSGNCILGGNVLAVAGGNIVGGKINKVQGTYSLGNLIMGNDNCIGDGSSSVGGAAAFGGGNCILADGTVAIGINNNNPVSGQTGYGCNTLLLGCNNQAHFGQNNIVGGTNSDGYGTNSIAFGFGATSATGGQQYAFGCGTTNPNNGTSANIANSMVIGRYNVWNITDCHLFAVGNGSSDGSRTNAFNVSSNGRVGIGCTSPQTPLDVNGTTRTTALVETSARRYKENIVSLQDQLDNLKKLEPVEFEWKETKKKDIGLIAEDVEKIYPQLVEHDDNGDLMGVKYSKITSLLIKAIQEQQDQIDELKKEIFILKQQG